MAFTIIILVLVLAGWFIWSSAKNSKKQNPYGKDPDKEKSEPDLPNRQV